MDDNISFQSQIRLVPQKTFNKCINGCRNNVKYPWTVKQTVCAPKALTEGVYDCTALGVNDGENVLFLHLCPTALQNNDWSKISEFIKNNIVSRLKPENLQALILGSKRNNINSPNSTGLFDYLEELLKKLNIEYSKFKGGNFENNLMYDSAKDEWLIGNSLLDGISNNVFGNVKNAANMIFDEVKIADFDELTW